MLTGIIAGIIYALLLAIPCLIFGVVALGTVITGKNGTVKTGNSTFGSAAETKVQNWKISIKGGVLDVTDSGSGDWREKIPQKRNSWSGSFEQLVKAGDTELTVNAIVQVHLVADDTTGDEVYWSGGAVVTDISFDTPIEGEDTVKRTVTIEGTGALTKTDSTQT